MEDNFIYIKDNSLDINVCQRMIELFEQSDLKTPSDNRNSKKSTDIYFDPRTLHNTDKWGEWGEVFVPLMHALKDGMGEYVKKYDMLEIMRPFQVNFFNIQRYQPGEGFYNWHCENNGDMSIINRNLVFMIYLNDLDNGGTEFLYQNHKEDAVAGKLVIWPAFWTHTHRGVISSTDKKYIVTGWWDYQGGTIYYNDEK
jgi:hypothetical protein